MKVLFLRSNILDDLEVIFKAGSLNSSESLDFSKNNIEKFEISNFSFNSLNKNLLSINMNENNLKFIGKISLENIIVLKLSHTKTLLSLETILNNNNTIILLKELDLSFNKIVFDLKSDFKIESLRILKLVSVNLTDLSLINGLLNENLVDINLS